MGCVGNCPVFAVAIAIQMDNEILLYLEHRKTTEVGQLPCSGGGGRAGIGGAVLSQSAERRRRCTPTMSTTAIDGVPSMTADSRELTSCGPNSNCTFFHPWHHFCHFFVFFNFQCFNFISNINKY
eukprot:15366603-Ditylum_brightwellii.AAC.2